MLLSFGFLSAMVDKTQPRATFFSQKAYFVRVLTPVGQKSQAKSPILCEKNNFSCVLAAMRDKNPNESNIFV